EADLCRARRPDLKVAAAYLAPANLPSVHDPMMVGPWRVPSWVPLGARRALLRWGVRRFVDPVALLEVNAARIERGLHPLPTLMPPDLPPAIFWQDYVPLRAVLPRVAALVHHGGIGTTAEALRAATPQLVAPLAHDQFDNAARVTALGAGHGLRAAKLDAARLA